MANLGETSGSGEPWNRLPPGVYVMEVTGADDLVDEAGNEILNDQGKAETRFTFTVPESSREAYDVDTPDGEQQSWGVRRKMTRTLGNAQKPSNLRKLFTSVFGPKGTETLDKWLKSGGTVDTTWILGGKVQATVSDYHAPNGKVYASINNHGPVADPVVLRAALSTLQSKMLQADAALFGKLFSVAVATPVAKATDDEVPF